MISTGIVDIPVWVVWMAIVGMGFVVGFLVGLLAGPETWRPK
jgi:hypothetical protein